MSGGSSAATDNLEAAFDIFRRVRRDVLCNDTIVEISRIMFYGDLAEYDACITALSHAHNDETFEMWLRGDEHELRVFPVYKKHLMHAIDFLAACRADCGYDMSVGLYSDVFTGMYPLRDLGCDVYFTAEVSIEELAYDRNLIEAWCYYRIVDNNDKLDDVDIVYDSFNDVVVCEALGNCRVVAVRGQHRTVEDMIKDKENERHGS